MTPEDKQRDTAAERAEKIARNFIVGWSDDKQKYNDVGLLAEQIASEIRAAVADGQQFYYDHITVNAIAQAKAEAYEDAAKIVESPAEPLGDLYDENLRGTPQSICKGLAQRIRARAKELK